MSYRVGFAALFVVSVVLGAGACSGPDFESEPGTAAEFLQRYAEAVCDPLPDCCAAGGWTYDRDACISAVKRTYAWDYVDGSGAGQFSRIRAAQCVARARAFSSACRSTAAADAEFEACANVFIGAKAAGESCRASAECQPPALCDKGQTADAVGTCVALYTRLMGESCQADYECATGAFCDVTSGRCVERKDLGERCTGISNECGDHGYCDPRPYVCFAKVGLGEPCSSSRQCETRACAPEGVCVELSAASRELCEGTSAGAG
jgi:hypothetical protein